MTDTSHIDYSNARHSEKSQAMLLNAKEMPATETIGIVKQWALNRIKTQHAASLKLLSGDATIEERDTWPVQLQAAKDFKAGRASDTQKAMLDALLLEGESKTALADRIIGKDSAIQTLIGMAGGLKRRTEKAVEKATTVEAIQTMMDNKAATEIDAAIAQFKATSA